MTSADGLQEFRVTFGLEYRHRPHPEWAPAHPDGWLAIEAPDEASARLVALRLAGRRWDGIYPVADFRPDDPMWELFPRGEIRCIPWGQVVLPERTDEELQAEDDQLFGGRDPDTDFDILQDMLDEGRE